MKDVIMWVLVILVILLALITALTTYQNHRLNLEIEGYSDQVMELERMLED
jgi:hypothetical protein